MTFKETIKVRWSDVDFNQHVRHSAYYDYGAHCRIRYFQKMGFGSEQFKEWNIGPVIFTEQCNFIKELRLDDIIEINMLIGKMKPDGSQWTFYHEIFNSKGDKCAHIMLKGAWMDTIKRRVIAPPKIITDAFIDLPQGSEFVYGK
jgi:acyl-CoA thioester hydrolase